ncbi:MAG: multicopper oxidase domain-containing protein, partial [Candidatus Binataceae bacterium]
LTYDAWTYDGAVPGPVLRVREGDEVTIKLVNPTTMAHGIDTHAAEVAPKLHFAAPNGQRNLSYTFRAGVPGAFLYQCSAIPTLSHVANGMYGMMIVDPAQGWPAAHEVMIVQGEYYGTPDKNGMVAGDSRKEVEERPDFVVFNGMIDRYVDHPIPIKTGELVRVFFVNAGPNLSSTFHVSGVIFSTVYRGGNPADAMHGLASFEVGPGDGAIFEFRVHEPGDYAFIDHALARTTKGAEGVFRATP